MDNTKEIEDAIKESEHGLNITDIVNETGISRGQIRTTLAFLLGAELITERQTGMAKLYFTKSSSTKEINSKVLASLGKKNE